MKPPRTIFGFSALWRAGVVPQEVARVDIHGFCVRALRWELRDVSVERLKLGRDGHIISFVVEASGESRALFQQRSVFYQEEDSPRLSSLQRKIGQGDGTSNPRWHKIDRHWPVEGGTPFNFVGQGYFDEKVVYLFRHPSSKQLAMFTDEISRQDAEEHYADEERRG